MSRALVLVAGLYVFLSPVVINKRENKNEKKQVLKVATDMNKAKCTTNNRTIECSLCTPFRYLLFSFTIFSFIFLSNLFFLLLLFWYFFLSKEHTRINHKNFELNWIKDMAYRKLGLCSKKHTKTCGPRNLIFLIEFRKSNFCEPSYAGMK
jgi:hypothetical protein